LSIGGKTFEYPLIKSIPMLEERLDRKPLMQDGNNMNQVIPIFWDRVRFDELFCPACGQVVASDLRTEDAMIYRGLLHMRECCGD
jgi:hypothetical protein